MHLTRSSETADSAIDEEWSRIIDELLGFLLLGPDWDGEGAEPPSRQAVDQAVRWVATVGRSTWPPPARSTPGVAGTILLEWQRSDALVEAEFDGSDRVVWMSCVPGTPAEHWESR